MSGITIKLTKPVTAHGQEVGELTLREPTTKDVRELGFPYAIDIEGQSRLIFDANVVAKYVVKLAGIPMGAVDQLQLSDFQVLQGAVQSFFGRSEADGAESETPPAAASLTAASSSPASGA